MMNTVVNDQNHPCAVPVKPDERAAVRAVIKRYAEDEALTPPLTIEELDTHIEKLVSIRALSSGFADYAMVLLNNEVWRQTVASTPCDRRLLLLPQCLRSSTSCPAGMDEFGLLCEECGRCPIGELQVMAEELGYVVLVAEGSTVVSKLLESGKVDTVIGVSCLSALEQSFSKMISNAIPGLAIPLHFDGCIDTKVDLEQVREAIAMKSDAKTAARLDTEKLRKEVLSWFQPSAISEIFEADSTITSTISCDWLTCGGNRWRPYLLTCVYSALKECGSQPPPPVRQLSVAVECFHKASLIHDDIEDDDDLRYGKNTLHCQYGMPVALNVGDFLIGVGYRFIADCDISDEKKARMLSVAATHHCELTLGQGEELYGMNRLQPFSSKETLNIFRQKTSPAFGLALLLGAIAADGGEELCDILSEFSLSLGVAYQIHDDLREFLDKENPIDAARIRSSLLLSLAFESAHGRMRSELLSFWQNKNPDEKQMLRLFHIFDELMIVEKTRQLKEHNKNTSLRKLAAIENQPIKSFLLRLVMNMLDQV